MSMRLALVLLAAVWSFALSPAGRAQATQPLTVFAASDLAPAFKTIAPAFERNASARLTLVVGSTGMLAQQIRNGAPADVFFAANESFVAGLESAGLTRAGTRTLYERGLLVIAVPAASHLRATELRALAAPQVRRVAIANPQHAPYGAAARQALQAAGLWDAVAPKLVFGENIQQAAQFVRTGAVEAGLIARSVADDPALRWQLVDSSLHAPLDQAAVVLSRSAQPHLAKAFIDFVIGPSGRPVMETFGFVTPGQAR